MKVDILDAYDRFRHVTKVDSKQGVDIGACCQSLIDKKPFGDHSFYIFAHTRTDDDGITQRMIWQPRLTKPKAEANSMLFRGYPGSDQIKIYWMIPKREMWSQFQKGNMTANQLVVESIYDFEHHRQELEKKEDEDLDDKAIDNIYSEIKKLALEKRRKTKQVIGAVSQVF